MVQLLCPLVEGSIFSLLEVYKPVDVNLSSEGVEYQRVLLAGVVSLDTEVGWGCNSMQTIHCLEEAFLVSYESAFLQQVPLKLLLHVGYT